MRVFGQNGPKSVCLAKNGQKGFSGLNRQKPVFLVKIDQIQFCWPKSTKASFSSQNRPKPNFRPKSTKTSLARHGAWKFGSKMAREPGSFGARIASKRAPNIACNLGGILLLMLRGGEPGSLEPKLTAKEPPILRAILMGLLLEMWHSVWQPR